MTLYNLILQDTIIENIALEDAMELGQQYAELEGKGKRNVRRFNCLPIGYQYRVKRGDDYILVASIEVSEG